jgi:hypothetical protein
MDAKDRQRLAVAHRILDATRHQSFRDETLATGTGDHVFVPALPSDTMAGLFDQLREIDGPLHVAVPEGDQITIFLMASNKPAKHASLPSGASDCCPISPESQVSMVLYYMRHRGGRILFREATPQISLELVEGPSSFPVPKPQRAQ